MNSEPPHPLFTCRKTFLQNTTITLFMWILGVSALLGNLAVVILRVISKPATRTASVQCTLISNLAFSDFLMGVYMVLLAFMDLYVGKSYFWAGKADDWRSSIPCQVAGFISVLSSEASVFLITLISVDRFIGVMFPFTQRRLSNVGSRVAVCVIWSVAFLLALTGTVLNYINPDAYLLSDVCVGLPLIRNPAGLLVESNPSIMNRYSVSLINTRATYYVSTGLFAIVLFLGINLASFIIIFVCYAAIFIKVRLVRAQAGRTDKANQEIKLALKMSLIVATDFFCWVPIITIGILVQAAGVRVSPDVYAWLVVFVLPVNSSINPFLYTILEMLRK
ncbi:G-protein coupled receptor GRL101-like [Diadema antillarum]|uniref:G-protein coupled receptor GRL101-like n=1 Tax=Diadema antillarum TaxID=105358 RepID=UPI003A85AB6B